MKLLTTAPPSVQFAPGTYLEAVGTLAQWNEAAGVEGMLIYTDNSLMDPWTVANKRKYEIACLISLRS